MEILEKYNLVINGENLNTNLPIKDENYYSTDIFRCILSQNSMPWRIRSIDMLEIHKMQKDIRGNYFFTSDSGFVFVQKSECIVYDIFSSMDAAEAGGVDETGDIATPLFRLPTNDFVEILETWARHLEKKESLF